MKERRYIAIRYDRGDEGSFCIDSFLNGMAEVILDLKGDGGFRLTVGHFHSDWGERYQQLVYYSGSYVETELGIECSANSRVCETKSSDHEFGGGEDESGERAEAAVKMKFAFFPRNGGLVCGVEEHGMEGLVMSESLTPVTHLL